MKRIPSHLFVCLGLLVSAAGVHCQAAQLIVTAQAESDSVELGNVDLPQVIEGSAAVTDTGEAPAADGRVDDARQDDKAKPVADAVPVAKPAATPMEKYRDAKLLQATTQSGGNPASARRYLKVDRATFQESLGVQ